MRLLQGDCLEVLRTLEAGTVQTCVTSPPYYGLRNYGVEGQIGLEESPEAYIAKLVAVFAEVKRARKDDGTLWVNIGDSYAGSGKGEGTEGTKQKTNRAWDIDRSKRLAPRWGGGNLPATGDLKPKDLIGIPWMLAFALRADGWYLRSEIIWHKPNPMPESVTDRPTKSHEQIFLLSKSSRYYYDAEAIAEPALNAGEPIKMPDGMATYEGSHGTIHKDGREKGAANNAIQSATRNKRTVWTVNSAPYKEAHFATYPPKLIEPCILAGTSARGECPKCGKAWERVVERGALVSTDGTSDDYKPTKATDDPKIKGRSDGWVPNHYIEKTTAGWRAQCDCGEEPVPQTVLDPFSGSGTTGAVATGHGRNYIGIELNAEYITLSMQRIGGLFMESPQDIC